jgi:trimeric autotransporter adhesin
LGLNAGTNLTTGSNNIDIGNSGVGGESNTIRIGSVQIRTFIKGISGVGVTGTAVVVNSSGQLGTAPSSQRFKDDIKPMDKASEAILALKPVTFRYKPELDPENIPQFGLVAEEVEKVNPALVARDAKGQIYTVRYDAVNAMLLNEFLKEHKGFVEAQHKVEKLETTVATLVATVKEQAAQIQKVSAQLEVSKAAPQTVANNQ